MSPRVLDHFLGNLFSIFIWNTLNNGWKLKSGEFYPRNSPELIITFQIDLFKDWGSGLIWKLFN